MAGKYRGPATDGPTVFVRLPTTVEVADVVRRLADAERRSVGNMVAVLVTEALEARGALSRRGKRTR